MKNFTIRVDLESDKGIRYGLPNLLDLFKKNDIRASFYLTIGGESNIFEIAKSLGKMKSSGERKIKIWSSCEKIRMLLLPRDFVKKNKSILRRILYEGHELGLHGYKHRAWTRNLNNLNIEKEFDKMVEKYFFYFNQKPVSFSSPGFNINEKVINSLDKNKIKYISDFDSFKKINNLINVPITIKGNNKMPFIEYWAGEGKSDDEILGIFKKEIENKNFVSFYIHGLFEGRYKIGLLNKMILELKKKGFKSKKIVEFKDEDFAGV